MFGWLFGRNDTVETKDGKRVKVKEFEAEGHVLTVDEKGNPKSYFGGTLTKVDDDVNETDIALMMDGID